MTDLYNRFQLKKKELERKTIENGLLERQAKECEDKLLRAVEEHEISSKALDFLESLALERRGGVKNRIEEVLTNAARFVYGDDRRVELSYSVKNNRSFLQFEIVKQTKDGEVRRAIDGEGSGLSLSDTVSVPLRILVLLSHKETDRVCFLDECFKHVDSESVPLIVSFLKTLTSEFGIQIIMLSHHTGMRETADVVFSASHDGEKTKISKTENSPR